MHISHFWKTHAVAASFAVSAHDLPTLDKIPVIKDVLDDHNFGAVVDIGIGTGFTTYSVFGDHPVVCLDCYAPNLSHYRKRISAVTRLGAPHCVVARATELPFKPNVFRAVLCSEVLEHIEDDQAAAREISRVLAEGGRVVVTVPHDRGGFASFLELLRIRTVHDAPGPEHHVRIGYTEEALANLLRRYGLQIEECRYYMRFLTRLVTDLVSLGHLLIEKLFYGRREWNWAELAELEGNVAFRLYARVFPLVWLITRLDKLLVWTRGFGLVMSATKRCGCRIVRE